MSVRAMVVPWMAAASLCLAATSAGAQSEVRPVEVSVVFTGVRFDRFEPLRELIVAPPGSVSSPWFEPSIGARLTYRFGPHVAVDWETNVFPRDPTRVAYVDEHGGRKTQLLAGPLVGRRFGATGLYVKIRPGLMAFRRLPAKQTLDEASAAISAYTVAPSTAAVLDIGGEIESRAFSAAIVRVDVGDLVVAYRPVPKELNAPYTTHMLQISASIGIRFSSR